MKTNKVTKPTQNNRTSVGLRDVLFDTMGKLIDGNITHRDALAVCAVSNAICQTVHLELKYARTKQDMEENSVPQPLVLGTPHAA
jgi:hypothetical protein